MGSSCGCVNEIEWLTKLILCPKRFPVLIRRPLDLYCWQFNSSTFICPLSHEQAEKTKGHDFNLTESKMLDPPGVEILFTGNNGGRVKVNYCYLRFFFLFLRILTGQRKAMMTWGLQPRVMTRSSPRNDQPPVSPGSAQTGNNFCCSVPV